MSWLANLALLVATILALDRGCQSTRVIQFTKKWSGRDSSYGESLVAVPAGMGFTKHFTCQKVKIFTFSTKFVAPRPYSLVNLCKCMHTINHITNSTECLSDKRIDSWIDVIHRRYAFAPR